MRWLASQPTQLGLIEMQREGEPNKIEKERLSSSLATVIIIEVNGGFFFVL